jgi:hypothetical protein
MNGPERIPVPKWMYWTGWAISVLLSLLLIFSASMKFTSSPDLAKGMEHLGWPMRFALFLGITELTCTILYLIPQTSVIGAILLTGYMGGAMATHGRIGEWFVLHIIIAVLIWLGIYLREPRLWPLMPIRK